ncbi:MAG TPA: bifunctional DNA-binding transcriptional regulator/O6-methylguanine-DNA methyltransferase Ada [Acidobacteriaceae bacterium]
MAGTFPSIDLVADTEIPDTELQIAQWWEQVLCRDGAATFFYAVKTTGIFCRPSCSSRRPRRQNVLFFADIEAAGRSGFRPCLRCQPDRQPEEAAMVERLVFYLDQATHRHVSLKELARVAGRAPATVQRLFTRVVGLSPRAWANSRRAAAYRQLLAGSAESITEAVYGAGFSGPSRAQEAAELGMAPRQYRAQGAGERIGYTVGEAPLFTAGLRTTLGRVAVAATSRGVCAVLLGSEDAELREELAQRFPRAQLAPDATLSGHLAAVLAQLSEHPAALSLPLDLRGTAFQARVWAALRAIPRGTTCSYGQLAAAIGAPTAVRAVAAACGQNPAAIVVPCHRVVGADGKLTGYRWGTERKRALLALEAETRESE